MRRRDLSIVTQQSGGSRQEQSGACPIPLSQVSGRALYPLPRASLVAQRVKHLPTMWDTQVQSLGQKDPLEKEMVPTLQVFLPGEFHGQRSLVSYSPRGRKELDTTE